MNKNYLTNQSAPNISAKRWRGWLWGAVLIAIFALPFTAQAQQTISGTVKDSKGEPLPGASVIIKNTTTGSSTDGDGKYQITANTGDILVATLTGYKNMEATVGAEATIDFTLAEDGVLDEVVVVGYGTQIKRDVTGSISQVKGKDLMATPSTSFDAALQGRAAGVQIVQSSGVPGSAVRMRIRGQSSISGSSEPLYVVDGVPVTSGDLSKRDGPSSAVNGNALADLNPNDIESIEVLKDASAGAIYGARAANGVVIITTKQGKAGKTVFNASYYAGVTQVTRKMEFVNGAEWLVLMDEAHRNSNGGLPMPATYNFGRGLTAGDVVAGGYNTNWREELLRTGSTQEANISASGGNEKTRFYIGSSYRKDNSFFKGNTYERGNFRVNLDNTATEKLTLGTQLGLTFSGNDNVPSTWGQAQSSALPVWPIRNPDGSYFGSTAAQGFQPGTGNSPSDRSREIDNPVAKLNNSFRTTNTRVLANVYADYKIIPGLNIRAEFGIDYLSQFDLDKRSPTVRGIFPRNYTTNTNGPKVMAGSFEERRLEVLNWNTQAYATYQKTFNEIHEIKATLGLGANKSTQALSGNYTNPTAGFRDAYYTGSNAGLQNFDTGLPVAPPEMGGYNGNLDFGYAFTSYFARVNYKYADKYLAGVSFRADGSSRFGENNRIGYFPAFSAGWIASNENFLKDVSFLSLLKLRASYGFTGNSEIPNFGYLATYGGGNSYLGQSGVEALRLANPDLQWEQSRQFDLGLDFELWRGRVSGTIGFYNKTANQILYFFPVQASTGFTSYLKNEKDLRMRNRGIEFNISTRNITTSEEGGFTWSTDFNIASNGNKVLSTAGLKPDAFAPGFGESRVVEGYPAGISYVIKSAGVDPADGRERFIAPDGSLVKGISDNTLLGTPGWFHALGRPFPRFTGGINNTVTYKGFELSFLFTFSEGNTIYDNEAKFQIGGITNNNQRRAILNRWQSPEQPGDGKTPLLTLEGRAQNSDRWIYDASFLRLRTVTLSYTLPKEIVNKVRLNNVRVYVTGQNLLLFTKYPGWDPEFTNTANSGNNGEYFKPSGASNQLSRFQQANLNFNVAQNPLPQTRTIIAGINLSF